MPLARSVLCAALLAGCGRVDFDVERDASATGDAFEARICDRYPQALYCNDFEDGLRDLELSEGMLTSNGGFGGSVGLSFTAGGMPRVTHELAPVFASGPFYIAARVFLEAGAFIGDYLVLAQATSNVESKISFDLVDLDTPQVVNSVNDAGGQHAATGSFPRGRWFCFELVIDVSAASDGGVTLSLDEEQVISGWQGLSTLPTGGWARVELGAFASPANTAVAMVTFDNWVVQTSPIGCP